MKNRFLTHLQDDILNRNGWYVLYLIAFLVSYVVTVEEIRILFDVLRLLLAVAALGCLLPIYLRCGAGRSPAQTKTIAGNLLFALALTLVQGYVVVWSFR